MKYINTAIKLLTLFTQPLIGHPFNNWSATLIIVFKGMFGDDVIPIPIKQAARTSNPINFKISQKNISDQISRNELSLHHYSSDILQVFFIMQLCASFEPLIQR